MDVSAGTLSGPIPLQQFARTAHPRAAHWADDFVLARERVGAAEIARLYRAVKTGDLVAVRPGVYLPAEVWTRLGIDDKYLMRLRAQALATRTPLVFAALSAAALWRLPTIGPWPTRPSVFAERTSGGRSTRALDRKCEGVPPLVWVVDGLATTDLATTVVDVARFAAFGIAVTMADRALAAGLAPGGVLAHRVDKAELRAAVAALDRRHGTTRVLAVIDFADGRSGSAGESISRVVIYRLGFPAPVLQFVFRDAAGRMIVDFWWPDFSLIGEFDGRGKYLRDEFLGGRSTAEAVLAEKDRENRLRAQGPTVTRWGWTEATSPQLLRRHLLAAGLPLQP